MPITIFCPFTRAWAVDRWLENLAAVEHDPKETNLCFIVDGDEPYIVTATKRFAEARGYRSYHVKVNEDWRPNEVRIAVRRNRIAEVNNQAKDLIAQTDGDIIIGLEDDTIFDRLKSFDQLTAPIRSSDQVGFVEGVQLGRWGVTMVGAWRADDINDPKRIETLLPGEGTQYITAGGWYGYATRRDLFLQCEHYASSAQPWGPDVNYGFWLNRHGYVCLVDWSILFGHDDHGTIMYPDNVLRLTQVVFTKNMNNGKWDRVDHEHHV